MRTARHFRDTLEQLDEFVCGEAGLFENVVKGSALQISAMERNDYKTRFGWMAKDSMRAGRVVQVKTVLE